MSEEKVCCICNEHKKFLGRINAGQKLYCIQCETKITKEYGMDYWKPCSQVEFFESMLSHMKKRSGKPNMFNNIRETIRQFEEEVKKEKKDE